MAGGPSQLDMFDYKPMLNKLNGEPMPASYLEGKRFAFMGSSHRTNLLGSRRTFKQYGKNGTWVSDLLPYTAKIIDELTLIRTCKTDLFNHAPAKLFMNTGTGQFGRPSLGSWLTYGLGSECEDLPGFVVLQSGPRGPRGGAVLWGSGMLPTTYQGVPLRNQGEPILNLTTPSSITGEKQVEALKAIRQLNQKRLELTGDDEISTRINAYEMAYRMQSSAPELMDTAGESAETLELYGIKDPKESSYARNCLLARRLAERGVRFIQLYHTNWDHHGGPTENLEEHLPSISREIDKPSAALILDLKRRGLLDDTIVIWGGEFGRTPWVKCVSRLAVTTISMHSRCGSLVAGFNRSRPWRNGRVWFRTDRRISPRSRYSRNIAASVRVESRAAERTCAGARFPIDWRATGPSGERSAGLRLSTVARLSIGLGTVSCA